MGCVILLSFLLGLDAMSITVMEIQLNAPQVLIYSFILVICFHSKKKKQVFLIMIILFQNFFE